MNKKVIAVVLAGAMFVSQFMGAAEALAANSSGDVETTASEASEKILEESFVEGDSDPVEAAGDSSVQTQAEVKAILAADGKVYGRTAANISNNSEITDLNTVTDLLVDKAVTSVADNLFAGKVKLTKLVFEGVSTDSKLTSIGVSAFKGTSIVEVVLPAALTNIGNSAFESILTLEMVTSTNATKLATIGEKAFKGNVNLSEFRFPVALTTIGKSAFEGTEAVTELDFSRSENLTNIGESAFMDSALQGTLDLSGIGMSSTGNSSPVEIKEKAFKNNYNIDKVILPTTLTGLTAETFKGTGLKTIEINEDCATVSPLAFPKTLGEITVKSGNANFVAANGVLYNTAKNTLVAYPGAKPDFTILASVTTIGQSALYENGILTIVAIPSGVTKIDIDAFKGSSKLRQIYLYNGGSGVGAGLQSIERGAFENTKTLESIDLRNAEELVDIKENAFKGSEVRVLTLGKKTKKFTLGTNAFDTVVTGKKVYFLTDNGDDIKGTELTTLMSTWAELKDAAKGSWIFYTKADTPKALADYKKMKLTGLVASAKYKIRIGNNSVDYTSDGRGEIDIKREWSGKTIYLTKAGTVTQDESDPQNISIKPIYTVMVDGALNTTTVAGEAITVTAPKKSGHTFKTWIAQGVNLSKPTAETITFSMPLKDVVLTTEYLRNGVMPTAAIDYPSMSLTGLSPNAAYIIGTQEITVDSNGKIALKKEWGGTTIQIKKKETQTETESPAQSLTIKTIHSISVNDVEAALSITGQSVTIKAPTPEGYQFKTWTAPTGVTIPIGDLTKETITFAMPNGDVKLKAEYTLVMTTKPGDLEYDREKEVSVEFAVPLAEFTGIKVNGVELVRNRDYTVSEAAVRTLASVKTVVTFTKTYLDSLEVGVNSFTAVLKAGTVNFSIKVPQKPQLPQQPQNPVVFPDVRANEWFYGPVNYVSANRLMTGYADGRFGPADSVGRGQFAAILHRIAGAPAVSFEAIFSDVPQGTFYTTPVVWAKKSSIITGYESGSFGPSDSMTREQLSTILYRFAMIKGGDITKKASIDAFPDGARVSSFAKEAMSWAVGTGIISGDGGNLNPQGISSRAVVATMIQRFQIKVQLQQP